MSVDPLDLLEQEARAAAEDPDPELLARLTEIDRLWTAEQTLQQKYKEYYAKAMDLNGQIQSGELDRPKGRLEMHRMLDIGNGCCVKAQKLKARRQALEVLVAQRQSAPR